jgi:hypothetical protein
LRQLARCDSEHEALDHHVGWRLSRIPMSPASRIRTKSRWGNRRRSARTIRMSTSSFAARRLTDSNSVAARASAPEARAPEKRLSASTLSLWCRRSTEQVELVDCRARESVRVEPSAGTPRS